MKFKNVTGDRYIKISAKSKGINILTTISSVYLEKEGDIINIPEKIFESNIIRGF